jgi:hypothetical protein
MLPPATFSVIGVRADGTRVELSVHPTQAAAENRLRLALKYAVGWRVVHIRVNLEDPTKPAVSIWRSPGQRQATVSVVPSPWEWPVA